MLRSTAVFSAMTFLSRLAGLVRDWLQATMFGTGAAVSAFVLAYRIPNYLRRIFAEGSFSSAFVPVLSELRQKGDEKALQDFLDHVAGALAAVVVAITAIGVLAAPWIARLFLLFADEDSELVDRTAEMLRITFPYLTFISMTALAGAVLNTFRHFGLPAFTPVLHNLGVIAAMLVLPRFLAVPERALAWGVFAAGLLQLLLLWPAMGRLGMAPRLRLDFRHPGVRRVFRLMLPTIFSSSVAQLNLLVGTVFASLLVVNAQSWLYYSDRLVEFPLGLIGVAIGTVILPQLSRHHADADSEGYSKSLDWGMRMVLLVGLPGGAPDRDPVQLRPVHRRRHPHGRLQRDGDEHRHSGVHAEQGAAAGVLRAPGHAYTHAHRDRHGDRQCRADGRAGDAAVVERRSMGPRRDRPGDRTGGDPQHVPALAPARPAGAAPARTRLGPLDAADRGRAAGDGRHGVVAARGHRRLVAPAWMDAGRGAVGRGRRGRGGLWAEPVRDRLATATPAPLAVRGSRLLHRSYTRDPGTAGLAGPSIETP
jgi:hypothetical protein